MKDYEKYQKRSREIEEAAQRSGNLLGTIIPWLMITVGVLVTAIQTHSLSYRGMSGSDLYAGWLDFASWLPVVLLEGTAVGLTLGRLYFFKGAEQRKLGHVSSFAVWGVLAFNTVAQFVVGNGGTLPAPLLFYVRYLLPLSIVAVPYLWKWLLDLHPDSQERIATLDVNAKYREQWRDVQTDQQNALIDAYRDAMESNEVKEAVLSLVRKAALQQATHIVGAINETEDKLRNEYQKAADSVPPKLVNGVAAYRDEDFM